MESFQTMLSGREGKRAAYNWQLLSFFALEAENQIALIGPCKSWFLKERDHSNPGANYLYGMVRLLVDACSWGSFTLLAPAECEEISRIASDMLQSVSSGSWTKEGIQTGEDWHQLGLFSQEILRKCDLSPKPRQEPYDFPSHMEVWWQDYKHFRQ